MNELGKLEDWRIDESAGRPILVYKNCSVIEAEQAEAVLDLIRSSKKNFESICEALNELHLEFLNVDMTNYPRIEKVIGNLERVIMK